MMRAYDEACLPLACDCLGRMLDYSVYSLRIDADSMMKLFIASGTSSLFARGDMRTITGGSGIELAYSVLEKSALPFERMPPRHTVSFSNEYWCGHALAYAQWATGLCFEDIMMRCPASVLISGCAKERLALLEGLPPDISDGDKAASLKRFGDEFARRTAGNILSGGSSGGQQDPSAIRLKTLRIKNGLSQSALADASGVPVRTIQQYEQRQKDINKAHFEYIIRLSAALNCEPADLFERGLTP